LIQFFLLLFWPCLAPRREKLFQAVHWSTERKRARGYAESRSNDPGLRGCHGYEQNLQTTGVSLVKEEIEVAKKKFRARRLHPDGTRDLAVAAAALGEINIAVQPFLTSLANEPQEIRAFCLRAAGRIKIISPR
jgi:hypothetical protein